MSAFASLVLRCGAYCRSAVAGGVAQQRQDLLGFTASRSNVMAIVDAYVDDGHAGEHLDRPQLNRLLEDARAGKLHGVIVPSMAHFSRVLEDIVTLYKELSDLGVVIIAVHERICSDAELHQVIFPHPNT